MAVTTTPQTGGEARRAGRGPGPRSAAACSTRRFCGSRSPDAFKKLDPRVQIRNPVMFVVEVGAAITTYTAIFNDKQPAFNWTIVVFLWLTVVFANLAEAVAEGRGKAQAETLRRTKRETVARRLIGWQPGQADTREEQVPGTQLTLGDHVVVEAGEIIPGDGDVVEGVASVDESAITGESAPVIRESGGDRSAVTGGTKVLSDRIVVHITSKPGETFIDRMIALVEGAQRQKTPNEIALNILLASLTIIFMLAVITLQPMAFYSGAPQSLVDPGRAAGRADPHHDRRAAVRDRHRRDGPAGPAQRAGRVRPRGRGGGRREHAAAGQDRHDHHRQPPGLGVPAGRRRDRGRAGRRRPAVQHGRLHPGGPVDRRARQRAVRPARAARGRATGCGVRRVHRADPDERHRPGRRPASPQGRLQRGPAVDPRQRRHPRGRTRPDGGRHLRGRRHPAGGGRAGATGPPGRSA